MTKQRASPPESGAEHLVGLGKFREAANLIESKISLTHAERVLQAGLEFELGDAERALAQANALLGLPLERRLKATCLAIIGRAQGSSGAPHEGLETLRRAVAMAGQCDHELEAQLLGVHANYLLSWIGLEPALVALPHVRSAVMRTGSKRAMVELYIAQARVASMRGAPQEASERMSSADELIDRESFFDLTWRMRQNQSIIALRDGDVEGARNFAQECLKLARHCQSKRRTGNTLGNLANIASQSGNFDVAKDLLKQCLALMEVKDPGRLAALNTGMSIGLATDDAAMVNTMTCQGSIGFDEAGTKSYYRLWFEIGRVKNLLRSDLAHEAVGITRSVGSDASRLADTELRDRFLLLEAEGLNRIGNQIQAQRVFYSACDPSARPSLELLAEQLRVAASLSTSPNKETSRYLSIAFRLLTSSGLFGVRREISRSAAQRCIDLRNPPSISGVRDSLVHLGTILKLGRHPLALGRELLAILRSDSFSVVVALIQQAPGEHKVLETTRETLSFGQRKKGDNSIPLGSTGRFEYFLRANTLRSVDDHIVWNSIANLAAGALALQANASILKAEGPLFPSEPVSLRSGMIVVGEKSSALLESTQKIAPSNIPVLVTGETGTGKELVARALHELSPRSSNPFVPFNCSAVSTDMLDGQLFGYRKGAFTGASEAFEGVIRAAAGGTLFLDEIGEITLDVQPKLLRFLESGEIHPLGEARPIRLDVRIVAATNADLEKLLAEGRFREDLYYRLNVVQLMVPPLRERREEIPPLAFHFLERHCQDLQKSSIRLGDTTMEYLVLYAWPGNIRQLGNEVRRMVALAESGTVLMPEHLSQAILSTRRTVPSAELPAGTSEIVVRTDQPLCAATQHLERAMILDALQRSGGKLEEAARTLGLSRKGLYLKRQRLRIDERLADAGTELSVVLGGNPIDH